jgi:acetylornithine deacetylase/succinyl-diaminopimelate desuccinylase-like protein
VAKETVEHLQALIRFDTTNPPGNETPAAEYLKRVFEGEGISAKLLALDPKRANLVVRIRGNGFKKPILIMGHTDVVGVQREKWSVDPFSALRKNGYIWGRGSLDDKDNVTAGLMVLLLLKRQKVKLDRDVIFLAEVGEEGFDKEGLRHAIANHWEEINAEFAIAEGGGGVIRDGKAHFVSVATTEKIPRGVQLIARGTAGHGSVPLRDNPVGRLAAAVARVGAWMPPMRFNETTRSYFGRLAEISSPDSAARYRSILIKEEQAEVEKYFAQKEPRHNSMLRTSISPTIIKGGFRNNVIPSDAEAYLDIRALPDEDIPAFMKRLEEVIADPKVEIKPSPWHPGAPSSKLKTDMFAALERAQKRVYPEAVTLPTLLTGATDMHQLRLKGVQAYGIGPLLEQKEVDRGGGVHGNDERILEKSLHDFVRFVWQAVLEVAAEK